MKQAPTSWMTDNSVVSCYFRCYTIHGTHNALVTRNTAFDTIGHCFYLEDGVEENNTITYNFAAKVAFIGPLANTGMRRCMCERVRVFVCVCVCVCFRACVRARV